MAACARLRPLDTVVCMASTVAPVATVTPGLCTKGTTPHCSTWTCNREGGREGARGGVDRRHGRMVRITGAQSMSRSHAETHKSTRAASVAAVKLLHMNELAAAHLPH